MRSWSSTVLICLVIVTASVPSFAQDAAGGGATSVLAEDARLDRAVNLYSAGQYEACVVEIKGMLDTSSAKPLRLPHIVELARTYLAACHLGANQPAEAEIPLRDAILANPQMRVPDSLTFPPPVIDAFLRMRQLLHAEILKREQEQIRAAEYQAREAERRRLIEQVRMDRLERLAATETVVTQNRRWVAAIPFGVGQFQNGNTPLGVTLLSAELAALGTFTAALFVERSAIARINEPGLSKTQVDRQTAIAHDVQTVAGYALLALAAGGIVEAQLSFVPEVRQVRPRTSPQTLERPKTGRAGYRPPLYGFRPALAPVRGGATVGFRLSF